MLTRSLWRSLMLIRALLLSPCSLLEPFLAPVKGFGKPLRTVTATFPEIVHARWLIPDVVSR